MEITSDGAFPVFVKKLAEFTTDSILCWELTGRGVESLLWRWSQWIRSLGHVTPRAHQFDTHCPKIVEVFVSTWLSSAQPIDKRQVNRDRFSARMTDVGTLVRYQYQTSFPIIVGLMKQLIAECVCDSVSDSSDRINLTSHPDLKVHNSVLRG